MKAHIDLAYNVSTLEVRECALQIAGGTALPGKSNLLVESLASLSVHRLFRSSRSNARLEPPAARNARIGREARIEGAPTVGCEPWLAFWAVRSRYIGNTLVQVHG
jgi:hypothetical protein